MIERERYGLPKLELPPEPELTPEGLAKRAEIVERILRRRDEIGPVDMTMEELFGDDDG